MLGVPGQMGYMVKVVSLTKKMKIGPLSIS